MTIRLNSSTSGYTELDAPAVGGNNTLRLPGDNGTSGYLMQTDGSGNLSWRDPTGLLTPYRNRIINGDMRIDQRNVGAAINSAGDGTWVVDRWVCYHSIATVNVGQNLNSVASINGIPNQLGIQITATATATGSQYTNFQHYIEGFNAADLAWGTSSAQSVTLSFWVRSSVTGTHGAAIQNGASTLGYPFTYTISSANTWEYKTITIAGPTTGTWNTTNGRGITLIFDLGQGPNFRFTAGSWQSANVQGTTGAISLNQTLNATWYITGVQLESGSVATPFERRSFGQELALCQRYFFKNLPLPIAPAKGNSAMLMPAVSGSFNGNRYYAYQFPVAMRGTPTIAFFNSDATAPDNTLKVYWDSSFTGQAQLNLTPTLDVNLGLGIAGYVQPGGAGTAIITGNITANAEL